MTDLRPAGVGLNILQRRNGQARGWALALLVCGWCWGNVARAQAARPVWIEEHPRQTVAGWGVAANFFDMPRGARDLLAGQSAATCFKLPLDGMIYDDDKQDGAFREERFGRLVFAVELLKSHGRQEYFTAADSPPASMKLYYSKRGHLDMNPNSIMRGREPDYARFVAKVFGQLRGRGLPLPIAHSPQDDTSRLQGSAACPYDAEQMARLAEELHGALARETLGVPLAGPEIAGYAASIAFATALGSDAKGTAEKMDIFAYRGKGRAAQEYAQGSGDATPPARESWMTGWACYGAVSENEAVVQAMQRLAGDLTWHGVTRWTWEAGYTQERTVYALLYGPGTKTKLFTVFQTLWKTVTPGFRVLRAGLGAPGSASPQSKGDELEAVAFEENGRRVLLLINAAAEAREVALPEPVEGDRLVWSSVETDDASSGPPAQPAAVAGSAPLRLAATSVSIVSWRTTRTEP